MNYTENVPYGIRHYVTVRVLFQTFKNTAQIIVKNAISALLYTAG